MPNSGASTIAGAVNAAMTSPISRLVDLEVGGEHRQHGIEQGRAETAAMLVANAIASGPR